MATYCIGDIQGCFKALQELLQLIAFDPNKDTLWCVGDLVNRGPHSLEVLRFLRQLPQTKIVLGNHDLHLLALYHKATTTKSTDLCSVLEAPDAADLIDWLRLQPLMYYDAQFDYVLVHAGIYPMWNFQQAKRHAAEVETVLRSDNYAELFKFMYGNYPNKWDSRLSGWPRLRFIINCFTRMRFCNLFGRLDFVSQGKVGSQPSGYMPWFKVPWRKNKDVKIVFGHWAALDGKTDEANTIALDTGCVWGRSLTAMRVEDGKYFQVMCEVPMCNIGD